MIRCLRTFCYRARGMPVNCLRAAVILPDVLTEQMAKEDAERVFAFLDKTLPAQVMRWLASLILERFP